MPNLVSSARELHAKVVVEAIEQEEGWWAVNMVANGFKPAHHGIAQPGVLLNHLPEDEPDGPIDTIDRVEVIEDDRNRQWVGERRLRADGGHPPVPPDPVSRESVCWEGLVPESQPLGQIEVSHRAVPRSNQNGSRGPPRRSGRKSRMTGQNQTGHHASQR